MSMQTAHQTRRNTLSAIAALAMLAVAFYLNYQASHALAWPALETQFRDVAFAQTILDGGYGDDAAYLNEHAWYNPLHGAAIALFSLVFHMPAHEFVARSGVFINLVAPVGFFILLMRMVNPAAATAGLAGLLFLGGNSFTSWESATYSAWLLPNSYLQGFVYLSLLVLHHAWSRAQQSRGHLAVGLCLGLIFLVHLAPALIFGCAIVAVAGMHGWYRRQWSIAARGAGISVAVALVVSMPLLYFIGWIYGFDTINPLPSTAPYYRLDLNEAPALLYDLFSIPFALGSAGVLWFVYENRVRVRGWVVGAWLASVVGLLALNYLRALLVKTGIEMPHIVPAFHLLNYLHAPVWFGFGYAVFRLVDALRAWMQRPWQSEALLVVVTGLFVAHAYGPYLQRPQFTSAVGEAAMYEAGLSKSVWRWLRENTSPQDVFLASREQALFVVSPAGRKVVSTNPYFSNPFVSWELREHDKDAMFEALRSADLLRFGTLAGPYSVDYVLWRDDAPLGLLKAAGATHIDHGLSIQALDRLGMQKLFEADGTAIYRVP